MKEYSIHLLAILIIFFTGCSKKAGNAGVYNINGLANMSVRQYVDTTVQVTLNAEYVSGNRDALTLTPVDLSSGVTVSPSFIYITPPSPAVFYFHVRANTAGTTPIKINIRSQSGEIKTSSFDLVVNPNADCSYFLTDTWTATDACYNYGNPHTYSSNIYKGGGVNQITIPFTFGAFVANIDCSSDSFTLVPQINSDFSLSGHGNYTANQINLYYHIIWDAGGTYDCSTTLAR